MKQTLPVKQPLPVLIYEPGSQLRHPMRLFQQMWSDLLRSRELAIQLFQRDLQVQYRQSILGVLWAFIPPIFAAVAATAVRRTLNLEKFGGVPEIPFPLYVLLSMSLWQAFQGSIIATKNGTKKAKGMMKKIQVPPEAFVLSAVGQVIFRFLIQITLFIIFVIGYNLIYQLTGKAEPVTLAWQSILAPVAFMHLIFLAVAVGLFLSPFALLYNDVMMVSTTILRGLFLLTPILYAPPTQGPLKLISQINPIYFLLGATRDLVMTGNIGQPTQFWIASIAAIILLLLGWIFNKVAIPILIERGA